MLPTLMDALRHHLSVGNALQNIAFYTFVCLLFMILLVQLNAHQETGIRRFSTTRFLRLRQVMHFAVKVLSHMVRRLFVNKAH
ncbi:hypothetical protein [Mucilaginibacter gilvus]|uniref:Uncharacterized protein n=1 Tax=Mucilaginibacter gilvus TaxID=2305909 RepID=A0A444MNB1_9SPHI|nr:hypothetical protein [Mucilaginibacter gilvus]RWY51174.1 hypothetical protein EPL05_14005 [Mucilaginibacter gilvus]